jgi:hypothetical protein
MAGRVFRTEQNISKHRVLVENPDGKGSSGKRTCMWSDNIKEIQWEGVHWIYVAQGRGIAAFVCPVTNLRVS